MYNQYFFQNKPKKKKKKGVGWVCRNALIQILSDSDHLKLAILRGDIVYDVKKER